MSLTLNVSKEAKLFYKNEEKIREWSEEKMIHPSSTIHMKKYSPAQSSTLRSTNNHLSKTSDESSDECSTEGPDQGRDDWMSQVEKNGNSIIKRRRIQSQRENSRFIPTSSSNPSHQSSFKYNHHLCKKAGNLNQSLKLKQGSHRRGLEKHWKQNQKEGPQQEEIKQKHSPQEDSGHSMTGNIPPRDLHGEANDSDGMDEKFDHILYDDISPAQNLHHLDDSLDMSEDENHNISENNPFAKQRILKSRYKNMYSV